MPIQLIFDLAEKYVPPKKTLIPNTTWMDVSAIAKCIGFNTSVEVSAALNDALGPLQTEDEDDYNQRLYDALWLAHHHLALDQRQSFSFTFDCLRDDKVIGRLEDISLRLRVDVQKNLTLLGLSQDF